MRRPAEYVMLPSVRLDPALHVFSGRGTKRYPRSVVADPVWLDGWRPTCAGGSRTVSSWRQLGLR